MDSVSIPIVEVQCALDAMEWTFSPYLDEPSKIKDYPWIIELITSYNSMISLLPEPFRSQHPLVTIE